MRLDLRGLVVQFLARLGVRVRLPPQDPPPAQTPVHDAPRFASSSSSSAESIGKYHLRKKLHSGAHATVYEAYDSVLEKYVALKVLADTSEERIVRFERAAKATARLQHPNIITIYALHDNQIVHRDIKPGHIFLTSAHTVKLLDFSLARWTQSSFRPSQWIPAEPCYMSPELVRGEPADRRADVFSAAAVLHELLTGHKPFGSGDVQTVFNGILNGRPPQLPKPLNAQYPELERILHRALAQDLQERYQTAQQFGEDLDGCRLEAPTPDYPESGS